MKQTFKKLLPYVMPAGVVAFLTSSASAQEATPILDPASIVRNIESAGTSVTTVVMAVIAVLLIIFAFKMVRRAFGG